MGGGEVSHPGCPQDCASGPTHAEPRGGGMWQQGVLVVLQATLSEPPDAAHPTARRSPPSDLAVASESPSSLRVTWTPPSGHVLHYRLTYMLASGSGREMSVGLGGAGRLLVGPPVPGAVTGREPTLSVEGGNTSVAEHRQMRAEMVWGGGA